MEQAGSPPPKKFKLSPSAGKVMLVAFWEFTWINSGLFHAKRLRCDC